MPNKYRISYTFSAETDEEAGHLAEVMNLALIRSHPVKLNDAIGEISIPKDGSINVFFQKLEG